jgi:hypothetical protein
MESPDMIARQAAAMRRRAEELVAAEVLANMLADLPDPSTGDKLAASHYALSSSTSPQALAARLWR